MNAPLAPEPLDVLLVEDSPADAELTLRALRKAQLTPHVVWVKDGQEAVDFLFGSADAAPEGAPRPKLILMDLKLPKLSGLEVLRRIKQDSRLRSIPVVMLTSSNEERDIVAAYSQGANSYLVKPVDFQGLSDQVARAGHYWIVANRNVQ